MPLPVVDQEVPHQNRDVLRALAERRRSHRNHPEPVVQILTQLTRLHSLFRILIRRRDESYIHHRVGLRASDSSNHSVLDHPQ